MADAAELDGGLDATGAAEASTDAGADVSVDAPADAADAGFETVMPFATGLDANRMPLADGQIDTHWQVKDAMGNSLPAYVQTDALGYPGYWLAPSGTSKFVTPYSDTVDPSGMGTFTYKTTFSLRSGVNVGAVGLVIRYASDNQMSAITLNGHALDTVAVGGYSAFETRMVTTGFVEGENTLEFVVGNSGGPTGARVELDLTAN